MELFSILLAGALGVTIMPDLKDGDRVSRLAVIRCLADSEAGIAKVSLAIDGVAFGEDTSTPYEFPWDTIAAAEGPHTLRFTAQDLDGVTGSKEITVSVDNQLDRGADAFLTEGEKFLADENPAAAVVSGRLSRKADPASVPAALFLGKAYLAADKPELASAEYEFAVNKTTDAAEQARRRALLIEAYLTWSRKLAMADRYPEIVWKAVEQQRAIQETELEALRKAADLGKAAEKFAYGSALLQARKFKDARNALAQAAAAEPNNRAYRFGATLAEYMLARPTGDLRTPLSAWMLEVERGQADAFTWAGLAACALDKQDSSDAKEKLRQLESADESDKNLALLQIELAWRQRRFERFRALFDKAQTVLGEDHPLSQAFLAYQRYLEDRNDLALAAAHKSLLADVTQPVTHTIRGLVYLLANWQEAINKYQAASVNFQMAQRLEPEEPFAYALEALAQMYDNHAELAEKAARNGLKESPKDALLYVCLAAAQVMRKDLPGSRDSLQKARDLDPQNYSFADPPKLSDLYKLILQHGRRPTLLLSSR